MGDYERAIRYSKQIFQQNENSPLFLNTMGIIYRRTKDYEQARLVTEKALDLDNTLVQAKLNIASIDIEEGLVDKAIYALKNVLKENNNYSEVKF